MKIRRNLLFLSLVLLFSLCLTACGEKTAADPSPLPAPTPTPFQEPVMSPGGPVSFDGNELSSLYIKDDVKYVKLSEAVSALGSELTVDVENSIYSFPWRKSSVKIIGGTDDITYLDTNSKLSTAAIPCSDGEDLYVPVESFCLASQIGLYYDEEYDHLYCTPGSGAWELPQGYNVPVMMYHGIQHAPPEANLFVDPYDFEEQLKYLTENGYTTIFFEDLWHVQDFEKPVILTFDDGWDNNYTAMFPILQKYNCKATIFVVEGFIHDNVTNHFSFEHLNELAKSELISLQSHTVTHDFLSQMSREDQEWQLTESQRFLTRITGKEPFVLAYPTGDHNDDTLDLVREHYRFGVKMMTYPYSCYNTSDDPTLIYRFFPERQTSLDTYISWLDQSFPDTSN